VELPEDVKLALSRLRLPGRRSANDAYEALLKYLISEARINQIAGCEGQTLAELQASFQLLPLGTRFALQSADAVMLREDVSRELFLVEVKPFALDLVQAAVALRDSRRRAEVGSVFDREVARIFAERFPLVPEPASEAPPSLAGLTVVGSFEVGGRLVRVDSATRLGAVELLDRHGQSIRNVSVHFSLDEFAPVAVGSELSLEFLVGTAKAQPAGVRFWKSRTHAPPVEIQDRVSTTPGTVPVYYDDDTVYFHDDEGEPNAVAGLRDVELETV
jgi:hypothetical protein